MAHILIAGVGGVLGRELLEAFLKKGVEVSGLALRDIEFKGLEAKLRRQSVADVTKPETLAGLCDDVDTVVSVIGITRMTGELTHMDVDYQGNANLLTEAKRAGVKKFVFISPAGTDIGARQGVPLMEAKFRFEEELKASGLAWVIIRAGGFFRDFAEMGKMALKGPLYVIGDGNVKCTPVDVKDLADLMAQDTMNVSNAFTEIGGPKDMTWNEICAACFTAVGKPTQISKMPVWICHAALAVLRPFSPQYYALGKMIVFFSVTDVPTARRGKHDLADYLKLALKVS